MNHTALQRWTALFWDALFFLLGSLLYAVSVNVFSAPNNIAPGGFTGIATMLNYLFGLPIGITILVMNVPFFILGAVQLGKKFLAKVIAATILSSVVIDLTAPFMPAYRGDMMLCCIFGGILSGAGLALIFLRGGATGGTDLIAKLVSKYVRFISLAHLLLIADIVVVLTTIPVYRTIESPLYAFIFIFVTTKVIDMVMYGNDSGTGKMMFIISQKNQEIKKHILEDMDRGVTELKSRGGYSGIEGEVLLCAVRRGEMHRTLDIVKKADDRAFVIVGDAHEITGEGFKEGETT
ncbi:MAG: YitT family protein [Oscillospiraceae bacterium]|jgi:uncharacterized membrane-anchored protein YitT (DUF2179 family)|nr:YitT family protein [Oscillospiraceae bacterium]